MGLSVKERMALLPTAERSALLRSLPATVLEEMHRGEWWFTARPEQMPPANDAFIYLFMAGRGAGKSRSGSEWIVEQVRKHPVDRHGIPTEWLVVADTLADARTINAEGPSGILNVLHRRKFDFRYKQSPRPMVLFPQGSKIYMEGADDPDTGRGYNAAGALLDEIAKWVRPYETWYEGLMPSLRADLINDFPRAFVTTTPKPISLLLEWVQRDDRSIHIITGSTFDNASNLSAPVLAELRRRYDGTSLGEQELHGRLLELTGGGLFKRLDIRNHRVPELPSEVEIVSTVVGMDPSLTGEDDLTGIVVAGRDKDNHIWILGDHSILAAGREACMEVWRVAAHYNADLVVYEENLGKRYLTETLQDTFGESISNGLFPKNTTPPMKAVHAKHGKKTRAEPVALRCEQGRVHMVGEFPKLEDEMVLYDPQSTRESPDRMDAMVHAALHLMAGEKRQMSISGSQSAYDFRLTQDLFDLSRLL